MQTHTKTCSRLSPLGLVVGTGQKQIVTKACGVCLIGIPKLTCHHFTHRYCLCESVCVCVCVPCTNKQSSSTARLGWVQSVCLPSFLNPLHCLPRAPAWINELLCRSTLHVYSRCSKSQRAHITMHCSGVDTMWWNTFSSLYLWGSKELCVLSSDKSRDCTFSRLHTQVMRFPPPQKRVQLTYI